MRERVLTAFFHEIKRAVTLCAFLSHSLTLSRTTFPPFHQVYTLLTRSKWNPAKDRRQDPKSIFALFPLFHSMLCHVVVAWPFLQREGLSKANIKLLLLHHTLSCSVARTTISYATIYLSSQLL